jgi:S1-C subfamily serine protease
VALGAVLLVTGSGSGSGGTSQTAGWLGIDTVPFAGASFPGIGGGVMIADVASGSPAAAAGLEPGDVITQVGSRQINSPGDVTAAIAGLHPGQQVQIQYQQGPIVYTTQATLAAKPASSP